MVALRDAETYELEGTEIHERAHLLHAAQDTLVQAVLRTLGAPDPSTYAARNAGEHFAEMAGEAWRLLNPPGVCLAESPEEQLAVADSLVPGTAGFVLYFLRHPTLAALPDAEAWRTAAAKRTAHASAAWERLFAAIERRRLPTGAFESWPVPSRREWLAAERRRMRSEGTLLARAQSLSLWPGAAMLQLLDH